MNFPESLVEAFADCCNADWENEEKYALYRAESKNFLRKKFEDKCEQCRLIVQLTNHLRQSVSISMGESMTSQKNIQAGNKSKQQDESHRTE